MLKRVYNWLKAKWKAFLRWLGIGVVAVAATSAVLFNVGSPSISVVNSADLTTKFQEYTATTTADKTFSRDGVAFKVMHRETMAQVEIGDSYANEFKPEFSIRNWGETEFKVKIPQAKLSGQQNIGFSEKRVGNSTSTKITWNDENNEWNWYQLENGDLEFEIILNSKPATNTITVDIETDNLEFYYQPPLDEEMASSTCTATDCGGSHRPENIVGSYAVYHSTASGDYSRNGGNNYRSGKAFHIYRPKLIDAKEDEVWAEIGIDKESGKMTIIMPPDFLDKAVYPVIVDPTFGYESAGASEDSFLLDIIHAQVYTFSDTGSFSSMSMYGDKHQGSDRDSQMAIYDINKNLMRDTATFNIDSYTNQWWSSNLDSNVTLEQGNYYLAVWGDSDASNYDDINYDTGALYGNSKYSGGTPFTWPDPIDFYVSAGESFIYSIYATYSCNTPTPSDFTYKKQITIEAGDISDGHVGGVATTTAGAFVVLATTTDANFAATSSSGRIENISENASTSDEYPLDFAIFASDETTPLSFEIEDYASTTGEIVLWIEVPSISSSTDQTVWAYYGYTGGVGYSCSQDTWDGADYDPVGVWHLSETPTVDSYAYDSTSNNNDGTFNGSMTAADQVASQIDGSLDFDGSNDYIEISNNDIDGLTAFTILAWINLDGDSDDDLIFKQSDINFGLNDTFLWRDEAATDHYASVIYDGAQYCGVNYSSAVPNYNVWEHVALTFVGAGNARMYINGTEDTSSPYDCSTVDNIYTSANDARFGFNSEVNRELDGTMDEIRIYNSTLTTADIKTMYNMEKDNSQFITWGAETPVSPSAGGPSNATPEIINFW